MFKYKIIKSIRQESKSRIESQVNLDISIFNDCYMLGELKENNIRVIIQMPFISNFNHFEKPYLLGNFEMLVNKECVYIRKGIEMFNNARSD